MFAGNNKKIKGFTLLELMIVLLISSIALIAVTRFLFSTITYDAYIEESVKMQDEVSFFNRFIEKDVMMAGFSISSVASNASKKPFNLEKTFDNVDGSSQFAITYENFNNNADCDGNTSLNKIENVYYLNNGNLMCNNLKIIENVNYFKVYYGIDINGDSISDRIVNAIEMKNILSSKTSSKPVFVIIEIMIKSNQEFLGKHEKQFKFYNKEKTIVDDSYLYKKLRNKYILKNMTFDNN